VVASAVVMESVIEESEEKLVIRTTKDEEKRLKREEGEFSWSVSIPRIHTILSWSF
jgi:hypothetical protein